MAGQAPPGNACRTAGMTAVQRPRSVHAVTCGSAAFGGLLQRGRGACPLSPPATCLRPEHVSANQGTGIHSWARLIRLRQFSNAWSEPPRPRARLKLTMNTENCGNACAHSETVTAPSLPGLIVTRVDSAAAPPRRKRRRASSLLASAEFSDVAVQASPCLPGSSSCGCLSVIPALLQFVLDLPGYRIVVVEATGRLSERRRSDHRSDLPAALGLGEWGARGRLRQPLEPVRVTITATNGADRPVDAAESGEG